MIKVNITTDESRFSLLVNSNTPLEQVSLVSLSKHVDDSSMLYLPSNDQEIEKTITKKSVTFDWYCWLNMARYIVELTQVPETPVVDLSGDDLARLSIIEKSE